MRIVGGMHRGRSISAPDGLKTRPTGDRVRESVFNILAHAGWRDGNILEDALIADIFAGTGALGIEALSRGGRHALFVEQETAAIRAIRDNLESLKETARADILRKDATHLGNRPESTAPRTLVFLDPPYGQNLGQRALVSLATGGWLAPKAVCVFEMERKKPEETPVGFTQHDERSYGVATVRFLTWNDA